MDVGTAMSVCAGCFSFVAIVYKVIPPKVCKDRNCPDHSGVMEAISNIKDCLERIDENVTALLKNGKGQ